MKVVNIKKNERYDVYIGRSSKHNGHVRNVLSNTFEIGIDGDRDEVIRKHAYQFLINWKTDSEFRSKVIALNGKTLGCFCSPDRCHGDNYIEFLNAFKMGGENLAIGVMEHIANGDQPPLYFNSKAITSSWLSNFYPCNVYSYPSLENAYFASKCSNVDDRDKYRYCSASEAKIKSKGIPVRTNWLSKLDNGGSFNEHVMETLSLYKFTHDEGLKEKLLSTKGRKLIHYADWGSRPDTFWGVDENLKGLNNQGVILMKVREIILNREINSTSRNIVSSNIMESTSQVIAHGCNRQGKLGSGVAKSLVDRYPEIRKPYVDECQKTGFPLGDIIKVKVDDGKWIVHMSTQTYYGFKRDEPYASPTALRKCLTSLMTWCVENNIRSISMPPVGAGRGGLEPETVYKIIKEIHDGFNQSIDLEIFDMSLYNKDRQATMLNI